MYSEEEMAMMSGKIDLHPITSTSFEFVQTIGILANDNVVLVAAEGELPNIAYKEGDLDG